MCRHPGSEPRFPPSSLHVTGRSVKMWRLHLPEIALKFQIHDLSLMGQPYQKHQYKVLSQADMECIEQSGQTQAKIPCRSVRQLPRPAHLRNWPNTPPPTPHRYQAQLPPSVELSSTYLTS